MVGFMGGFGDRVVNDVELLDEFFRLYDGFDCVVFDMNLWSEFFV